MFTQAQLDLIATARFGKFYRVTFTLPGGTLKWTTQPHDDNGFTKDHYINGIGDIKEVTGIKANQAKLELVGVVSVFAAFEDAENSSVKIEMALHDNSEIVGDWINLFEGFIDKFEKKKTKTTSTLIIEMIDMVSNKSGSNVYQMTPNDQKRRFPDDNCLKYISQAAEPVNWGKES